VKHKFLTKVDVHRDAENEGGEWIVDNPLVFVSDILGTITVPEGFTTDFASVPRLPIAFAVFGGVAEAPAVVHDYLYSETDTERSICDAVFLEAMEAVGISWWKRRAMWLAVRAAGWAVRSKKRG